MYPRLLVSMKKEKIIKINYVSYISKHYVPSPRNIKKWIYLSIAKDLINHVNLIFVGEKRMQTLNNKYLKKDKPTNVLTFTYKEKEIIYGDIILCPKIINSEAKEFGFSSDSRWAHMIIHAMLHLQGHRHNSKKNRAFMENIEVKLLTSMNFGNPYVRN